MKTERLTTATLWTVCGALAAANVFVACSDRTAQTRPQPQGDTTQVAPPVSPETLPAAQPEPSAPAVTKPVTPLTPEETKTAWREGVALYDAKDYAGAADRLGVAVAGRENDAYAHYLFGLALWKSGETPRAEQELARSAELGSGSLRTQINLARVRLDIGDAPGALSASEAALAIDPSSVTAMHQKGRALVALQRTDDALVVLEAALTADPHEGHVANTLGWLLIQQGRPADAVPALETARESLPDVAYVRNNLGVAYERTGRKEEALAEFRAAVACGDSAGKAAESLARLGDEEGDGTTDVPSSSTTAVIPTVPKETTPKETTKSAEPTVKTPAPSGR